MACAAADRLNRSSTSRLRRGSTATTTRRTSSTLTGHCSLHHLSSGIKHDIHQRIERRIRVRFLRQTVLESLGGTSEGHVGEVVAHDATDRAAVGAYHLLDNVAQIVHQER